MAAVVGWNLVCGRRCQELWVHTGHIDIIEKMVSEQIEKWFMHDAFLPYFMHCHLVESHKDVAAAVGQNSVRGTRYDESRAHPGKQQFNWNIITESIFLVCVHYKFLLVHWLSNHSRWLERANDQSRGRYLNLEETLYFICWMKLISHSLDI